MAMDSRGRVRGVEGAKGSRMWWGGDGELCRRVSHTTHNTPLSIPPTPQVMWVSAGVSALGGLMTLLITRETRDKSIEEVDAGSRVLQRYQLTRGGLAGQIEAAAAPSVFEAHSPEGMGATGGSSSSSSGGAGVRKEGEAAAAGSDTEPLNRGGGGGAGISGGGLLGSWRKGGYGSISPSASGNSIGSAAASSSGGIGSGGGGGVGGRLVGGVGGAATAAVYTVLPSNVDPPPSLIQSAGRFLAGGSSGEGEMGRSGGRGALPATSQFGSHALAREDEPHRGAAVAAAVS